MVSPGTGRSISFAYEDDRNDVGAYSSNGPSGARLASVRYDDGDQTTRVNLKHSYARTSDAHAYYEYKLILDGLESYDDGGGLVNQERFTYDFTKRSDGTYLTYSRLSPYVDSWGYLNELSDAGVDISDRKPAEDYYIYVLSDLTDNSLYQVDGAYRDGLTKLPKLEGSRHGSLVGHEDGLGLKRTFGLGLHEVQRYIATSIEDTDEGQRTELFDLETCRIVRPDGSTDWCRDVCSVSPEKTSENEVVRLDPAKAYLLELSVSQIQNLYNPNRSPTDCLSDVPIDDYPYGVVGISSPTDGNILYRPVVLNASEIDESNPDGSISILVNLWDHDERLLSDAQDGLDMQFTLGSISSRHISRARLYEISPDDREAYPDRLVGGLRVDRVTVTDQISSKSSVVEYLYQDLTGEDATSGELLREPTYGAASGYQFGEDPGGIIIIERTTEGCKPTNSILSYQGAHVLYEHVIRRQTGQGGYTLASYKVPTVNVPGNQSPGLSRLEALGLVYDPAEGRLEGMYRYSDEGTLVSSEEYAYLPVERFGSDNRSHFTLALDSWIWPGRGTGVTAGCAYPEPPFQPPFTME